MPCLYVNKNELPEYIIRTGYIALLTSAQKLIPLSRTVFSVQIHPLIKVFDCKYRLKQVISSARNDKTIKL